jgi:hypothetical protein
MSRKHKTKEYRESMRKHFLRLSANGGEYWARHQLRNVARPWANDRVASSKGRCCLSDVQINLRATTATASKTAILKMRLAPDIVAYYKDY